MNKVFQEIFRRTYPKMLFYAIRLIGEHDAEDIVQDVFIEFWKKEYNTDKAGEVDAILYRSVYNRCLNYLKHKDLIENKSEILKMLTAERMAYYSPCNSEVISRIENKELRKKIDSAIEQLPEKCRRAFVMSYLYGVPDKEIASIMEVSPRTVEAHIYKALRFLRERLSLSSFLFLFFLKNFKG